MARKVAILIYGGTVYALFLAVFVYAIGFIGNVAVPKGIDDGPAGPWGLALAINGVLLAPALSPGSAGGATPTNRPRCSPRIWQADPDASARA